jgi:O-antigen ligase
MLSQIVMTVKGLVLIAAAVYGFAALLRKEDAAWVKRAPLWIMLSMFMIGMWGHFVWIAYIALLAALPIAAKSRADAAALYCVLTVSMPYLNLNFFAGGHYVLALNKYVFCALGLGVALILRREKTFVLKRARFDIPVLIIAVLELAQARDPIVTETIRQSLPALLMILLPYFLLSRALNTPEDIRRFLIALTLAGFVMAAVATVEARLHWLIYKGIEQNLDLHSRLSGYGKMRAGMLRAPASFPESTSLGTFLAIACMAAFSVRTSFASTGKWIVMLFVLLLGLLSANSRGAVIAVAIGAIAWDFYCRRYGALSAKILAAGFAYLCALTLAQFSPFFAAMVGKGSGTQATTDYRFELLRRGMEEIHKHPILGQTLKAALDNLEDLRQGEGIIDLVNGYISFGLTLGYPGIIGLALTFVSLALAMFAARRKLQANRRLMESAACVFAVAVFSIPNSFFTGFGGANSTDFYQICAIGSALWAMRGAAAHVPGKAGEPAPLLPGIAGLIAADRDRAQVNAMTGTGAQAARA